VFFTAHLGERGLKQFWRTMMTTLKTLTILAALLAGRTSLALAQNGPATGGEPPVSGGAGGNTAAPGYYYGAPAYFGAPGYVEGRAPVEPGYRPIPHHRRIYMSTYGTGGKRTLRTTPSNGMRE
jgi:hypothetical protein